MLYFPSFYMSYSVLYHKDDDYRSVLVSYNSLRCVLLDTGTGLLHFNINVRNLSVVRSTCECVLLGQLVNLQIVLFVATYIVLEVHKQLVSYVSVCGVRSVRSSGVDHWSFLASSPAARWTGSSAGRKMLSLLCPITSWLTMTLSAVTRWNRRSLKQWASIRCVRYSLPEKCGLLERAQRFNLLYFLGFWR